MTSTLSPCIPRQTTSTDAFKFHKNTQKTAKNRADMETPKAEVTRSNRVGCAIFFNDLVFFHVVSKSLMAPMWHPNKS